VALGRRKTQAAPAAASAQASQELVELQDAKRALLRDNGALLQMVQSAEADAGAAADALAERGASQRAQLAAARRATARTGFLLGALADLCADLNGGAGCMGLEAALGAADGEGALARRVDVVAAKLRAHIIRPEERAAAASPSKKNAPAVVGGGGGAEEEEEVAAGGGGAVVPAAAAAAAAAAMPMPRTVRATRRAAAAALKEQQAKRRVLHAELGRVKAEVHHLRVQTETAEASTAAAIQQQQQQSRQSLLSPSHAQQQQSRQGAAAAAAAARRAAALGGARATLAAASGALGAGRATLVALEEEVRVTNAAVLRVPEMQAELLHHRASLEAQLAQREGAHDASLRSHTAALATLAKLDAEGRALKPRLQRARQRAHGASHNAVRKRLQGAAARLQRANAQCVHLEAAIAAATAAAERAAATAAEQAEERREAAAALRLAKQRLAPRRQQEADRARWRRPTDAEAHARAERHPYVKAAFEARVCRQEQQRAALAGTVRRLLGAEYDEGVSRMEAQREVGDELTRTAAVRDGLYRAALAKEVARQQGATAGAKQQMLQQQEQTQQQQQPVGAGGGGRLATVVTLEDLLQLNETGGGPEEEEAEASEEPEAVAVAAAAAAAAEPRLAPWQRRQGHSLVGQAQAWRRGASAAAGSGGREARPRAVRAGAGGSLGRRLLPGTRAARGHAESAAALRRPQDDARAKLLREAQKTPVGARAPSFKATRSVSVVEVLPLAAVPSAESVLA
jgi:hypothetical protein